MQTNVLEAEVVSGAAVTRRKVARQTVYSGSARLRILVATVLPFHVPALPPGGFTLPDYLGGLEKRSERFNAMGDAAASIGDAPAER